MAEAAHSKTLVSSGLANDDGVLLNQEGGKIADAQDGVASPEPPIAEFWGKYGEDVDGDEDSDRENERSNFIENVVGKKGDGKDTSFDDILKGEETGEGFSGSEIVGIEAPVVEKLFGPLNVELSGKNIEEKCRPSDGNGGPDFTEDGPGKTALPINDSEENYAGKVSISDSDPTKLLYELRSIAKGTPVESMLELTGLKSCLSAFSRYNGGKELASYQEVVGFEGVEDQTKNVSGQSVMQRCVGLSENNLSGTRRSKRKSVAKLMKEGHSVETSTKKVKRIDEQISSSKNDAQIFTPMRGSCLEEESEKITNTASVGERMKRAAAKLLGTSPVMKNKYGDTSAALSGTQSLADMETSPQEVLTRVKFAAIDPYLGSDTCEMLRNSISAYKNAVYNTEGSSKSSSLELSLGVEEEHDGEGLIYIREKLKKMTEMVENCKGGDVSSEWKASLEKEAKELLEKIGAMAAKPSSS